MDNYRLLAQKDEIYQLIKKAPVSSIGEIWQTLPFKRDVYQISNLEVLSNALVFQTKLPFDFDPNFPVYIRVNPKNLIFKLTARDFKTSKNQLSCSYPKEAKAIESRAKPRTKLPKKHDLHLTLRTLSSESVIDLKVFLEDVSEVGIGIKTSTLNAEFFRKNSFFKIIKVCNHIQTEEAVLNVRHIYFPDNKSSAFVGLSASQNLSPRFFEIIRDEMKQGKAWAG